MRFTFDGADIDVFSLLPRTLDTMSYRSNLLQIAHLSDLHGCTGVLIYTGHDVYIDPWLAAQTIITNSESLKPLVAVNPIYMHPFTAARMVSSLAYTHKRGVFLNLVTGTSNRDLYAFSDPLTHDERYDRLLEYAFILKHLLTGEPVTFDGRFYQLKNLQLLPVIEESLRPRYCVAGQSSSALKVSQEVGAVALQMLPPLLRADTSMARGINMGIITRDLVGDAWEAARDRYPEDREGQMVLALSLKNTESEWKRRLKLAADQKENCAAGYWMEPFKNFQADQPVFVGSHAQVSSLIVDLVKSGIRMFVLDIPLERAEFENVSVAFEKAAKILSRT